MRSARVVSRVMRITFGDGAFLTGAARAHPARHHKHSQRRMKNIESKKKRVRKVYHRIREVWPGGRWTIEVRASKSDNRRQIIIEEQRCWPGVVSTNLAPAEKIGCRGKPSDSPRVG